MSDIVGLGVDVKVDLDFDPFFLREGLKLVE